VPELLADPGSIMAEAKKIRITHNPSGEIIAEGPLGWGIMPFEGNYYIPHVEQNIFECYKSEICKEIEKQRTIVEPGAGSCEKIKWLLPELEPVTYVPMDISGSHLRE